MNQIRSILRPVGTGGGTGSTTRNTRVGKKFRLTDTELVVQNIVNALNIDSGSVVGYPAYGTTLRTFLFEPNTGDTQSQIETEIRRVISLDPRVEPNLINIFPQENGILIEIELAINPFNQAIQLSLFADAESGVVTQT